MVNKHRSLSLIVIFGLFAICTRAEIKPAAIFGDHMVLQRDKPVPVWGTADPGEEVTVEFAGQTKASTADKDGNWKVVLDPMEASSEGRDLVLKSSLDPRPSTLHDVVVGEVWLGSGQSNMDSVIAFYGTMVEPARKLATNPQLRFFGRPGWNGDGKGYFTGNYRKSHADQIPDNTWVAIDRESVLSCSALLFFFAHRLHAELGVPIGVMNRGIGASKAQAWLPAGSLAGDPACQADVDRNAELLTYSQRFQNGKASGKSRRLVVDWSNEPKRDGKGYTERIKPIVGFAVRGLCWDQGEAGPGTRASPITTLACLIRSWRGLWGVETAEWPVLVVQKPQGYGWSGTFSPQPFEASRPHLDRGPYENAPWYSWNAYKGDAWSYYQIVDRLEHVHVVNSMDLGHSTHPEDKDAYGYRMADLALARVYGHQAAHHSPRLMEATTKGDRIRLRFTDVGEGLQILGDADRLRGFRIAGADRVFFDAEATIIGADQVDVHSAMVSDPEVVLYARPLTEPPESKQAKRTMRQVADGIGNLGSSDGLQAFPFRSAPWAPPGDAAITRLQAMLDGDEAEAAKYCLRQLGIE